MRKSIRSRAKRLVGMVVAITIVTAALTGAGLVLSVPQAQVAEATTGRDFRAGNIISDSIFFDSRTMTAGDVQSFLEARVRSCRSGYTCLKDHRQDTADRRVDPMCNGYRGARAESAATIIVKVAQSCGINPQALIVLLQKEQGLVTDTWPTARQYRVATGYGCPDTAPCDAEYYGFFNQVYMAAWAFKRYTQPAGTGPGTEWYSRFDQRYPVGRTTAVLYNPNTSCGTQPVYIENQATHALYIYTPYVPNAAALNAGYASGDACSAYGNRNFFLYFSDWFGSTQNPVSTAIAAKYAAVGGASGLLGAARGAQVCGLRGGGCLQAYANGSIYASTTSPASVLTGPMLSKWGSQNWENGSLGYPVGDVRTGLRDGGSWQQFQGGAIYASAATGARIVLESVRAKWGTQNWENGRLGYPTTDTACGLRDQGCWQAFQSGSVYVSASTGARFVETPVLDNWGSVGWENSALGYPISDTRATAGGAAWQQFAGGTLYVPARGATMTIEPAAAARWAAEGADSGALGAPTSSTSCEDLPGGGCRTVFTGGHVYTSDTTAAFALSGDFLTLWNSADGVDELGYPTSGVVAGLRDGASMQRFQNATVYRTPRTTVAVAREAMAAWGATGYERGALGYPLTAAVSVDGNSEQRFEGGWIMSGPSGFFVVSDGNRQAAAAAAAGAPTSGAICGLIDRGCVQRFVSGNLYSSASSPSVVVPAALLSKYGQSGWERGSLGYPARAAVCGLPDSGCFQEFRGGSIYTSASTPAVNVSGAMRSAWEGLGWERGSLGYPTSDAICGLADGGCVQRFQGGNIYSSAHGVFAVPTALLGQYGTSGWERGSLGYPARAAVCGLPNSGCFQEFRGGSIYVSASSPASAVGGAMRSAWAATGWERGTLGYPVSNAICGLRDGGCVQRFQGGNLYQRAAGVHAVVAPVLARYETSGWEGGALGYPVGSLRCGLVRDGCFQEFQRGAVYVSASTGAFSVEGAIRTTWAQSGWERGRFGYPSGQQTCTGGVCTQQFEGGVITR